MGQEMSFIDDQERDAAAFAVLGGDQRGGLGGEGGAAVGRPPSAVTTWCGVFPLLWTPN